MSSSSSMKLSVASPTMKGRKNAVLNTTEPGRPARTKVAMA